MTAKVWFDEQSVEHECLAVGLTPKHTVVKEVVLFFHFRGDAQRLDGNALQLDTPATEKHKQDYKRELEAFVSTKAEMQKAVVVEQLGEPEND